MDTDFLAQAAEADAAADEIFARIETARLRIPADYMGARPLHVPGCEALASEARSLREKARRLREEAKLAAPSAITSTRNSGKALVQPVGTPQPLPSPSQVMAGALPYAATNPGTPAPVPSVDGRENDSEAERVAARILDSDRETPGAGQPADEIDAVALRIVGEPTAESEIDRIARRIAGVDA